VITWQTHKRKKQEKIAEGEDVKVVKAKAVCLGLQENNTIMRRNRNFRKDGSSFRM
jgi:hypothetical protein